MKGLYGKSRIMMGDEQLVVYRHESPPIFVDGKPVESAIKTFSIRCNVQPLTGLDLMRVPEMDRHLERFVVYNSEIEKPANLNDRISRCGVNYQVENVETWGGQPNGYQKLIIVRIDVGPNKTP